MSGNEPEDPVDPKTPNPEFSPISTRKRQLKSAQSVEDLRKLWEGRKGSMLSGVTKEDDDSENRPVNLSAAQEASGVIRPGYVRQQSGVFVAADPIDFDDILKVSATTLVQYNGYLPVYIDNVHDEVSLGIISISRAKTYSELNTLHIEADFKSTGISDKSAKVGEAASGKVISGHNLPAEYFAAIDAERYSEDPELRKKYAHLPPEVYPLPDYMRDSNGNPQFVTHERQTLGTIEARIASGYYRIQRTTIEDGVFVRIIVDECGKRYRIEYDPKLLEPLAFKTGSPLTVRERKRLIETKRELDLETRKASDWRFDKTKILNSDGRVLYESFAGLDDLIKRNIDLSVPLFREYTVDESQYQTPFVLCNAKGRPIKGDVDGQALLQSNDLPLMAYQYINVHDNGPRGDLMAHDINDLKKHMREFWKKLEGMCVTDSAKKDKYRKLMTYVAEAIKNIERIQEERLKIHTVASQELLRHPDEILLKEIGTLNLMNAVLIFAKQDGRLHGPESGSPLFPENIAVSHIPNPNSIKGDFIVTHGEYEFVKTLLNTPNLAEGHLMDFNLCQLLPNQKWRVDMKDKVCPHDGKLHTYLNKTDEEYSVKLHRLLLEKQLLECRREFTVDRYNAYVKILLRNFEIMMDNIKLKDAAKEALRAEMEAGLRVAVAIIGSVAACKDIDGRLEQIAAITQHSSDTIVRSNLDGIPLLEGAEPIIRRRSTRFDSESSQPRREP